MRVLLLAGGNSSENQVSLNTGAAIYEALRRLGHEIVAVDPAGGRLLTGPDGKYNAVLPPKDSSVTERSQGKALEVAVGTNNLKHVDVVLLALHGGEGENGTVQGLLDLAGVKYTGSSMAASAIAMNKAITKRLMMTENVSTPDWLLFRYRGEDQEAGFKSAVLQKFTFPLIIKPNDGGSTVGLTKVKREEEIIPAIRLAAKECRDVLVEAFIAGRELTVAVLDGEPLPVVEIRPKNELYDYEAKYTKGKSEYIAPAPVDPQIAVRVQEDAAKVFNVIGAEGLARVDFLMTEDGRTYCLEINTLPGMTNLSLAPMSARCAGIDFDALIQRILRSAMDK